jgi:hypothetical protein
MGRRVIGPWHVRTLVSTLYYPGLYLRYSVLWYVVFYKKNRHISLNLHIYESLVHAW